MPFDPPPIGCLCPACTDTPAYTYTEEFRHECEVRSVLAMDIVKAVNYLVGVMKKRGEPAVDRIMKDLPRSRMLEIADFRKAAPDGIYTASEAQPRSSDEAAYFGVSG